MDFEHKVGALDDEDLVVGEKEEKNWKGIVISLLVIGSIMGAIIVSIILCTPTGDVDTNRMKLDFDMVASDQLMRELRFNGAWVSEHEIVYVDRNGSIVILDAEKNGTASMLVKTYDKTLHTMTGFKLSADRQSILFVSEMRYEFGAPASGRYAIFNISSQTVEYLEDLIKADSPMRAPRIQYAAWGPAPNSILFIESNDIYYVPDFARPAPLNGLKQCLRLTKTGALSESIRNGIPDGLYRWSIFGGSGGGAGGQPAEEASLWWSEDGRHLAYLAFDDAQVEASPIEYYDSYLSELNTNPKIHYERYARAGGIIPRASVHVIDVAAAVAASSSARPADDDAQDEATPEASNIAAPSELLKQQQQDPRLGHYVSYVGWLANNQLLVMWTNRAQNGSIMSVCDPARASSSLFGGAPSRPAGWRCEVLSTFAYRCPPSSDARRTIVSALSGQGSRLIFFALPRPDSVIGDHYHVAMLRGDERAPKYLTHGEFDVDRLIGYDAATDTLYFEVRISETAERHLYAISNVGQMTARQTRCLTCHLDEPCGYNYAHLSPGTRKRYFVHECLGPAIPSARMRSLDTLAEGGRPARTLASLGTSQQLETLLRGKQMPIERFVAITVNARVPYEVHLKMYLPNEIEEEKEKRFPLLIESTEIDKRNVWKRFELDWGKYLVSRKQLIYVKVDCIRSKQSAGGSSSSSSSSSALGGAGYSLTSASSSGADFAASSVAAAAAAAAASASASASAPAAALSYSYDEDQSLGSPLFNAKDQVEVIKYLVENVDQFPYIDRRRIAIYGPTSTSAYVALATLMNDDSKLIGCTIVVSPITNWRYMSAYTAEHYLGLPWLESNSLRYERTNLLKRGYEFALRKMLVVHGSADEQVHVQHSMQFMKALTEHHMTAGGVLHQMQLYPDVGHSLESVRRHHLMTMDGFVDRCFYQKSITIKATEWKGKVRPKLY